MAVMKIESIQYSAKRNGGEILITFSDKTTLALDAELAVRFQLSVGIVISQDKRDQITTENNMILAKRKLIRYLSLRKKTILDAKRYLALDGFAPDIIEYATESAIRQGYLDDKSYAESYVRTKLNQHKYGVNYLRHELKNKGISSSIIETTLSEFSTKDSELNNARAIAAKKFPDLNREENPTVAAGKLIRFLASRGFSIDICSRISREMFGDPTEF